MKKIVYFKYFSLVCALCSLLFLIPDVQSLFCHQFTFAVSKQFVSFAVVMCLFFIIIPSIVDKCVYFSHCGKDNNRKIHLLSFVIFSIVVFFDLFSKKFSGDDIAFQSLINNSLLPTVLVERFTNWTSRIIIETFVIGIVNANHFFWTFFSTVFVVGIFDTIVNVTLSTEHRKFAGLIYMMFFFIPNVVLCDAGWGATTLNYLWPLAAAMPAFILLKKAINNESFVFFDSLYAIILLLFSVNSEQMALLVSCSFLLYVLYMFHNKSIRKVPVFCWIAIAISMLSLVIILLTPGNASRMIVETNINFPEFNTLNPFKKIELGFLSTLPFYYCNGFSYPKNSILLLLLFLCAIVSYEKKDKKLFLVQIFTALFLFALCYLPLFLIKIGVVPHKPLFLFSNVFLDHFSIHSHGFVMLEEAVYILLVLSLFYSIYSCFQSRRKAVVVCLVLLAGLFSRLTMGFSPSVYVSGTRTFFFMTIALFVVSSYVIAEILQIRKVDLKFLAIRIAVFSVIVMSIYWSTRLHDKVCGESFYGKDAVEILR